MKETSKQPPTPSTPKELKSTIGETHSLLLKLEREYDYLNPYVHPSNLPKK